MGSLNTPSEKPLAMWYILTPLKYDDMVLLLRFFTFIQAINSSTLSELMGRVMSTPVSS